MKKNNSLPIFGVGPIYVLSCLVLTILGLVLNYKGYLEIGKVDKAKTLFVIIGFILIILGLFLWVKAVLIQKINARVKDEMLITNGVYGIVRNPVYTAFICIFTGILLFAKNYLLLVLPIIFWIYLTILMKKSEEKWLRAKFGKEYDLYCKRVNRVIPWFPKK